MPDTSFALITMIALHCSSNYGPQRGHVRPDWLRALPNVRLMLDSSPKY